MNSAVFALYLLNLVLIGALPFLFFKRGRLNLAWWLTAAPFHLCVLLLFLAFFGVVSPLTENRDFVRGLLEGLSVPLSAASIALIAFARGSHRIPIALWHQKGDAPEHIVTYGAYGLVRHPFYAAFLLALLGVALFAPHPATLATFAYGLLRLNFTAAKEERNLRASQFGAEYEAYMRRTGRFWPRLGGRAI